MDRLAAQGTQSIQLDSLAYDRVFDTGRANGSPPRRPQPGATARRDGGRRPRLVSAQSTGPSGMTVGLHICSGNARSAYGGSGSYEAVAERLFDEIPGRRFLLEYDTGQGGFEPLRFVPKNGPTVVLGLIAAKFPQLEDPAEPRGPDRPHGRLAATSREQPDPA